MGADRDFTLLASAAGPVYLCRFVSLSANDGECVQSGANAPTIGVTLDHSYYAGGLPGEDGRIAEPLAPVPIYGPARKCLLALGAAVTRGQNLVSDANGMGVPAAATGTANQNVGAIALQNGTTGQRVLVLVTNEVVRPT